MFSSKNFNSYRYSSSPPPVPHLHAPLLGIIIRGNSELGKEKRNNTPCLLRVLANSPSWAWTTFPSFSQLIATCSSDASSKLHPQKSSSSSFPPLPHNVGEGSFIIISCYFFSPMYLFIFDCAGSLLLRGFFSSCDEWEPPSSCCAQASHLQGLVVDHALLGMQASVVAAPGLLSTGTIVMVHRLSCSEPCGVFPEQGLNPYLLQWPVDSLPLSHQESAHITCIHSTFTASN